MIKGSAMITGGEQPLGRAVADRLAEADVPAVIGVANAEHLTALGDTTESVGVQRIRADPRDEFDLERLAEAAARVGHDDGIGLVVPAARIRHGAAGDPVTDTAYAAVDDELRTNVRGVYATVREAAPHCSDEARVLVPVWTGETVDGTFAAGERAITQLVAELNDSTSMRIATVRVGDPSGPSSAEQAASAIEDALDQPLDAFDGSTVAGVY